MQRLITFFHDLDWESPLGWGVALALIPPGVIFFLYIGPLPWLAYELQHWAAGSSWDWKDRWASVRGAAVFFILLVVLMGASLILPAPFIYQPLSDAWQHLSLLGAFSLWPLLPAPILVRWLLALPLAPALALMLEHLSPAASHSLTRVLQPHEQAEMQQQQTVAIAEQAAQQTAAHTGTASEPEPPPQVKPKRATKTLEDRPKGTQKRLYPRKKPRQDLAAHSGPEDGVPEGEPEPAAPAPQPAPPAKPKIDFRQVQE